jgi:serine/threonine protein kinase
MVLQDKWRLDSLLGVGGMAAVYAATHRNGKRVAVKMLHSEYSHVDEVRTRFLQEGYAANTIQHEGAVSVLDDDLAPDGSAFLVMELLDGETVERRSELRGGKLPPFEVLQIANQLLDVLAAAHAKSVIHRDIKPENLFITKTGELKVLDFGIAKVFERHATGTATRSGTVMGTPSFMAPEQARARWEDVDGRTDLWAVGATMFTLLAGRHVHEAPSPQEQLILSATAPAPAVAGVQPEVPANVAAIVDRALAFDRNGRWPDARTMQEAVRVVLGTLDESAALSGEGWPTRSRSTAVGGSRLLVPTSTPAFGTSGQTSASTMERETRAAEVLKMKTAVNDLQQSLGSARKRLADAQARVDEARLERKSLEQWFHRRVGTRTAAAQHARDAMRAQLVAFARRAMADTATFGGDLDPLRDRVTTLQRAAESARHDVAVHEAALVAHEPRALRRGIILSILLLLALVVAPVVWRATRVIEPALPKIQEPAR